MIGMRRQRASCTQALMRIRARQRHHISNGCHTVSFEPIMALIVPSCAARIQNPNTLRASLHTGALHTSRVLFDAACSSATSAPQSPAPLSTSSTALPVAAELLSELLLILARVPESRWCAVSDVYAELPVAVRRRHVRPHGTMLRVLEKVKDELDITLSSSGVYYAKGKAPPEEKGEDATKGGACEANKNADDALHGAGGVSVKAATAATPTSLTSPDDGPGVGGDTPPPVDFYYDVGLREVPPPPPDFDVTPSALGRAQGTADGSVLALSDFVHFVPPFFVPLPDALANMPGYTEAHIEGYLSTSKAFELVCVGGCKYARLYGGYAKINLDGCEDAEEHFAAFKPDRSLVPAFTAAFAGVTEQWMPLQMLLRRSDPAAVAKLPFRGPAAIVYFAQMQDVFGFSVDKDGAASSVMLRRPGYGGLECETTPTPKSFNHLLRAVPPEGNVDVQAVESELPPALRAEVATYYGDILRFFDAHAPVFSVSEDRTVVMRTRYRRRLHNAALPLEEQLRIAQERRDKNKIRTLRRRIAFRDNPAHPYHDPDNLAREVAKYLPRKGFVTLKVFLKKHIPEDIIFFMPKKTHNFFENYPQYFQQFEYQQAGTWAISRPGQPLPRGVIRANFSEEDLVALVAEMLQQKGSRSCTTIFLNVPRGAQEMIRKRHGGVFYFAKKYPEYFNVVLGSDTANAMSSAVVHLVQIPTRTSRQDSDADSDETHHETHPDGEGKNAEGGEEEEEREGNSSFDASPDSSVHGGRTEQITSGHRHPT